MSGFKPGDEVVCIVGPEGFECPTKPRLGAVYTVSSVEPSPDSECSECGSTVGIDFVELSDPDDLFCPCGFRKVQRRDLQSWLNTSVPNTEHLDKPLPAKKRERAE